MGPVNKPIPARRKSWQMKTRSEKKEKEQNNKEEERGRMIEIVPDKAREALKKGLVLTNIKLS